MEKVCEFCMALRPVVYCKADAAHLCLFCDVKVHSANTLSHRHPRMLLCEVCRYCPAYVQCSDHQKFICRGCDCSLHKGSYQHQKKMVNSYTGCPSPKDFALLWDLEINKGHVMSLTLDAECEVGLSNQHTEVLCEEGQNQSMCTILQQIFELERLQLTERNNVSSFKSGKQQSNSSSSIYDTWRKLDKSLLHPLSVDTDPNPETSVEPFASMFPPLEDLTSSSTVENTLHGEPFWQCGSLDQDFEMWSENIQDLGTCEGFTSFDNSNIPDVDMTFQNIEEIFEFDDQGVEDDLLDEKEFTISSSENDTTSLHKLIYSYSKGIEGCSYPIPTDYSTTSLSILDLCANRNYTDYMNTSFSTVLRQELPSDPLEPKSAEVESRGNRSMRFNYKKKGRQYEKQSQGSSQKRPIQESAQKFQRVVNPTMLM